MKKYEDRTQSNVKKTTLEGKEDSRIVTGRKQAARWEGGKNKRKNAQAGKAKKSDQE
jgi:hypothetical protein